MSAGTKFRKVFASAVLFAATVVLASCSDDPGPRQLPNVVAMRLLSGTQTVGVNSQGICNGCPLRVPNNGTVRVQFFKADGFPDERAPEGEYILRLDLPEGNPIGFSFTPDEALPFRGVVTSTATGPVFVKFGLFDTIDEVDRFGPFTVLLNVQ